MPLISATTIHIKAFIKLMNDVNKFEPESYLASYIYIAIQTFRMLEAVFWTKLVIQILCLLKVL